jgi:hypothetical protein
VGLERGPLSLVSTTEELLDRKVAVRLENREYDCKDPSSSLRNTVYPLFVGEVSANFAR